MYLSKYIAFEPLVLPKAVAIELNQKKAKDLKIKCHSSSAVDNCLNNVQEYLKNNDGEIQLGWKVSVWGNVVAQLIGHAVVKTKDNKMFCITPRVDSKKSIKFVPDNSINELIKNNRLPSKSIGLVEDPLVTKWLVLEQHIERVHSSGVAALTAAQSAEYNNQRVLNYMNLEPLARKVTLKGDLCFCGSNKKRYKCCQI